LIALIVVILSYALSTLVFFLKNKRVNAGLASLAILAYLALPFAGRIFENYIDIPYLGSIGFVLNNLNQPFFYTIVAVTAASSYYSVRYMEVRFKELEAQRAWNLYYGLYSLFAVSMVDVTISTNLIELYIFLEIALVTSFLLILLYGYGNRRRISLMYFIWTHVGTILLLSSILSIDVLSPTHNVNLYSSAFRFQEYSSYLGAYAPLVFGLAAIGMLIKAAMFVFNIWLPYAHGEAPTPISVLLSPNTVGLGVFVIILYFYLFPGLNYFAVPLMVWSLITMVYGGVMANAQGDFKRFLAYSSVSQMGYMLFAASTSFLTGLSPSLISIPLGVTAASLIYVSHGLGKAILFMSAGSAITELETREISKLGGLYLSSPLNTALAFIGFLNLLGLPPTVGLLSEVLLVLSAGQMAIKFGEAVFIAVTAALMIAIGITSAYTTNAFRKIYGGFKEVAKSMDRVIPYSVPMVLLASLSILFLLDPSILYLPNSSLAPLLPYLGSSIGNDYLLPIIVLLPSLSSLISIVTPKGLNQDVRGYLSFGTIVGSLIASSLTLSKTLAGAVESYNLGYFSFRADLLQSVLAVAVSGLSAMISLYSVGYMREDRVLRRYWGFFDFFVSSMLTVTLSGNFLLFITGWEGTSLASYALISYWLDDNARNIVGDPGRRVMGLEFVSTPTVSGVRAMIFTRVADVGLIMGFGAMLSFAGSFSLYDPSFGLLTKGISGLMTVLPFGWVILLITFLGGLSKSAQFPFTQWLLTAMTGPTPVSALIHAATMVNLGAFFTFFVYPYLTPYLGQGQLVLFSSVMLGVSLFTAIYTALNGLVSNEQKVILAYSTADQISLMITASSAGLLLGSLTRNPQWVYAGVAAGVIQFIAHGLYKASLFMNAGSVIHYVESRYVGVVRKLYSKLPSVFGLQLIAALNLASFPFLIGYWGHVGVDDLASRLGIGWVVLISDLLGSIYIMRLLLKTFAWNRGEEVGHGHLHSTMIVAPSILVLATVILGIYFSPLAHLIKYFSPLSPPYSLDPLTILVAFIGIATSAAIYLRGMEPGSIRSLSPLVNFLYYGWFVNPAFDALGFAYNRFSISLFRNFETGVIDNFLNNWIPSSAISFGRKAFGIQSGVVREYIGVYAAGFALLLLIVVLFLFGVI